MRVRFGRCLFDGDARELRRDGVPQPLSPKAFQFLELLLEERPRAVAKQEIHERLWPASFVSDSSLARLAAEVRSALGDDAKAPRLLRTIHRFGYAFSGDVVAEAAARARRRPTCRLVWAERQIPLLDGENLLGRASDARVVHRPGPRVAPPRADRGRGRARPSSRTSAARTARFCGASR